MDSTTLWWHFWTICFIVAGLSFAAIAAVVAVRGLAALKSLIHTLAQKHPPGESPSRDGDLDRPRSA